MSVDRLEAIETFVRVVETKSFSAAARIQNIGQPAVSKGIAQLEDWLGVRLIVRSTRGLSPTEAGLTFYDKAQKMVEEAHAAVLAARGAAASLTGRIRVSAAVCFARLHIVPKLPAFLAAHPDLDVDLLLEDRNVDLVEEGVDVALRMGALSDATMTCRKIAERRRLIIATPSYFQRHARPRSPHDLADHQAIIYTRDHGGEAYTFTRDNEAVPIRMAGRLRVSATEGLRAAVFAHVGLTVASEFAFLPELQRGEVVTALDDWTLPAINLYAVFPTGRMPSTKARAFVSFVEDCLKEG
jgi:DNA-binding transcriptional LysR family regulator